MTNLYSIKLVLHPEGDMQERRVDLYLDSLERSSELEKIDYKYSVLGKGLETIEKYEERNRDTRKTLRCNDECYGLLWRSYF